jgi:hypothetical protein
VSYDAVAILRDFAASHGITYPLLSDEGSHVMRALELINARVQEDHAAYGIAPNPRHVGLPYPGVFVLDRNGVITEKRFHESYRERETGAGLVAQALGIDTPPAGSVARADGATVNARAWLDSPTYAFFQRLTLTVELSVATGHFVYGHPEKEGLPVSIEVEPIAGAQVGPARWPAARRVSGANGPRWVHEGVVRGTVPLTFAAAPGGGDHVLGVTLHYQACGDGSRLEPASIRLAVPIREAPLVGRSLPSPTATG